ncbi:MAG: hypothetical protein DRI97_10370 [Bacteroidetes bacterium]|nr:MAG: hypothetical protein DRI97_10370 [Bacteroidota bacterium]RLD70291.1 MAG: hypothetical protein DRI98_08290 [Bacteroidota bacterium]RLD95082.1 MAG: hypothetical protein DRJ29_03980 [Bacteroidota bacterium]RLE02315.1 MAG: hypothetical protein DRJ13_05705 [Bacteroidota bacterium]
MKPIVIFSLMAMMFSCKASKVSQETAGGLAPVLVYKTKADYSRLVPITLNETRDKVVSFPAPTDLYTNGILAIPVQLDKGYLLDMRGVHANTAFTSYTYEAYSKLESTPSVQDLISSIIDPDPFEELYDCGNRSQFKRLEKDLNKLIRKKFKGCNKLI